LGFTYDFSAYPGRRLYWRILFLLFSTAATVILIVAFVFLVEALSAVSILQNTTLPPENTVVHLIGVLLSFQSSMIVATFLFGPWLCMLLISVASHPTNQPHHLRWFLVSTAVIFVMVALWTQWFFFMPTLFSIAEISMPPFPQNPVYLPETISVLWGHCHFNCLPFNVCQSCQYRGVVLVVHELTSI
jgi:hypothetical protein